MASENVVQVLVRRHVTGTQRPFSAVLEGIYGGISSRHGRPFRKARSGSVWSSHVALVSHPD